MKTGDTFGEICCYGAEDTPEHNSANLTELIYAKMWFILSKYCQ